MTAPAKYPGSGRLRNPVLNTSVDMRESGIGRPLPTFLKSNKTKDDLPLLVFLLLVYAIDEFTKLTVLRRLFFLVRQNVTLPV